jgi:hypothetical protein
METMPKRTSNGNPKPKHLVNAIFFSPIKTNFLAKREKKNPPNGKKKTKAKK